jgi:hypothetical protein
MEASHFIPDKRLKEDQQGAVQDEQDHGYHLTTQEKWNIVALTYREYNPTTNSYPDDVIDKVARCVKRDCKTVRRVQSEYYEKFANDPSVVPDLSPKAHSHRDSRLAVHEPCMIEAFKNSRGHFYYDEQSEKQHIPKTTLFRWMRDLGIRNSKSFIKPSLTVVQKLKRIAFILHRIENPLNVRDYCSLSNEDFDAARKFRFASFHGHSWIDESFFFLKHLHIRTKELPGIKFVNPDDSTLSKSHIPKVMFLILIALPQRNSTTGQVFDGKVGIRPLVKMVPAKRRSKNRAAGTIELKPFSMVGPEYRTFLIERNGLFDALHESGLIIGIQHWTIQQDGAKPHVNKDIVAEISLSGHLNGRNIDVSTQPPQSPDLNVLDLAFLHSLQCFARRIKYSVSSVVDFVQQVTKAFEEYPIEKLLRCCAMQLVAYREILKDLGGNQYEFPHTGIRQRQRNNILNNPAYGTYQDCGDYEVEAGIIRSAVIFYEETVGEPFPWEKSPHCNTDQSQTDTSSYQYFDSSQDQDPADDPNYESGSEDDSDDDRDPASDDDF